MQLLESLVCVPREVKPALFSGEEGGGGGAPIIRISILPTYSLLGAGVRFGCGGWVAGLSWCR